MKGFLKFLFTILLLAFVFSKVDISKVFLILLGFDPIFFICAFFIQFTLSIVQAHRWRFILKSTHIKINFVGAWLNVLIGLFFNQAFPSSIGGDAIRIYLAKSIGLGAAFRSIVIDRIFALLVLSTISLCICTIFYILSSNLPYILLMLIAEIIVIIGCFAPLLLKPIISSLNNFKKLNFNSINTFCYQYRTIFFDQKQIVPIILMSIIIHFFVSVSAVLLFIGMGINISPITLGSIFALVNLFSVIPISFGGWGLREGIAIVLFSSLNIQSEVVFAVSVLFGFLMMVVGLSGGAVWILTSEKNKELKL